MPAKATKVLANANELLLVLADRGALAPAEIAQIIGMPRPSVYRLVDALEVIGLVAVGHDGRAELGLRNLHLAEATLTTIDELVPARPLLRQLAEESGQTAYFCVRRGERIVCVDWVQGERVTLMALTPGNSLPLHAGATSRVISANDPGVLGSLDSDAQFERFTPYTLTSRAELAADAQAVLLRGYSISDQDVTPGVAAIGAAVIDARGRLHGAISIAGLRDQVLEDAPTMGRRLHDVAERVAAALTQ